MPGRFTPLPAEIEAADLDAGSRPARRGRPSPARAPRPSSIRISCPGAATSARPSNVTPSSPGRGPSPDAQHQHVAGDDAARLGQPAAIRSFGPCRSAITASGRPISSCARRTARIDARCSSRGSPCEKLRRAASMPDHASARPSRRSRSPGRSCRRSWCAAARFAHRAPGPSGSRTRPGPGSARRRPAPPRCAGAGCTWRRARVRDGAPVLIWPAFGGDGEVGDGRVLGLARAVRDDRRVAVALRQARSCRASRSACRSGSP